MSFAIRTNREDPPENAPEQGLEAALRNVTHPEWREPDPQLRRCRLHHRTQRKRQDDAAERHLLSGPPAIRDPPSAVQGKSKEEAREIATRELNRVCLTAP